MNRPTEARLRSREEDNERRRESRLRSWATRRGLALRKSRTGGVPRHRGRIEGLALDDRGGFMIIDPYRNWIVAGERFDLDLDAVEAFLTAKDSGGAP